MRAGEPAWSTMLNNLTAVAFSSLPGLIVGESLIGVIIAVIIVLSVTTGGGESHLN